MDIEFKNAVILPVISPNSLTFGSLDPYDNKEIFKDGDLTNYLPEFESQAMTYMDSYGCVSNSFENALEAVIKKTLNDDYWLRDNIYLNGYPNFSDRDLVVLSGTIPRVGNSGEKVLQTAQDKGLIAQTIADWDTTGRDTNLVEQNYYAYTRLPSSERLAKEFNKRYKITGTWVHRNNWEQASKEGALQVYVKAWYKNSEGKYYNPNGTSNHAVIMANYKETKIFDTYEPRIKQLTSWDDAHIWALKINITRLMANKPILENNTLIQLVEGQGNFGLYLDDKIFVDDLSKIIASWLVRNNGNLNGKTKALTLEDWNLFDKYNLKNEKL